MAGSTRNKKVVRNIFIISIFIAIIFPFINIFLIYPSFSRLIVWNTEEDAVRTGTHLASLLFGKEKKPLTKDSFPDWFINDRDKIKNSLNLMKIKLFAPLGETIFSTETRDIGIINKNSYFHEIVAKGNPFSKIVKKDSKSLEGHVYREGVAATIIGRPNVGKSSLMNRLLEKERAIVTAVPGTTRDFIEETVNIKGIP